MKRQRGQSVVEFALMAPIVCLLIFGGIYGGIMFMDYLNFSNEARTVARQIAVADDTRRAELLEKYKWDGTSDKQTFARFYTVTVRATTNDTDAIVQVDFNRDNKDLPTVVYLIGFPPKDFKIVYRMQLERH